MKAKVHKAHKSHNVALGTGCVSREADTEWLASRMFFKKCLW